MVLQIVPLGGSRAIARQTTAIMVIIRHLHILTIMFPTLLTLLLRAGQSTLVQIRAPQVSPTLLSGVIH